MGILKESVRSVIDETSNHPIEEGVVASVAKIWAGITAGSFVGSAGAYSGAAVGALAAGAGLVSPMVIVPSAAVGGLAAFLAGARIGWKVSSRVINSTFGSSSEDIAKSLVDIVRKRDDMIEKASGSETPEKYKSKIDKLSLKQSNIARALEKAVKSDLKANNITLAEKEIYEKIIANAAEAKLSYLAS